MANIESDTLLEKLTQINTIKNQIRQAIIDSGGANYINEQTLFSDFPNSIRSTYSNIKACCTLLEYILFGNVDIESKIEEDKLTYDDLIEYFNSLANQKETLVANLRLKGITCSTDESLESLINKINLIN